jgi:LysM repeat protein
LGLLEDQATHMGFPAYENHCLHAKPPKAPSFAHQQAFCLDAYQQCPLYQARAAAPMPVEMSAPEAGSGAAFKIILASLVLLIVAGVVWLGWSGRMKFPGAFWAAQAPESSTLTPALPMVSTSAALTPAPATGTATVSLPASPTTALPVAATAMPLLRLHRFEVIKIPPGSQQGYLPHLVLEGEALDLLADRYKTTVQAILAVNYKLTPPVWADYPLVIPVGAKEATGLPALEVYVVDRETATLTAEALASRLGIEAADLEAYNLCSDNCQFQAGDVLLIPSVR